MKYLTPKLLLLLMISGFLTILFTMSIISTNEQLERESLNPHHPFVVRCLDDVSYWYLPMEGILAPRINPQTLTPTLCTE